MTSAPTTHGAPDAGSDSADAVRMFRLMALARQFERELGAVFAEGKLAGWFHSCEGHEATGATLALCLRDTDHLVPYHRSRVALFAKGMTPREVAAEMMGRIAAESRGRGGDGHIVSPKNRIYGMSGVLGASTPIAAGVAYASQLRGTDEVTVNGFGDGTANRGAVHEAMNLAAIWSLPVVFICENNLYAEFSSIRDQTRVEHLAERGAAFGVPTAIVDGNDPDAVLPVVADAVERARSGGGPTLIESKTYRLRGHYDGDPQAYRDKAEIEEWAARDPVPTYRARIVDTGRASEDELAAIEAEVAEVVDDAMTWALAQPLPGADTITQDVYAGARA